MKQLLLAVLLSAFTVCSWAETLSGECGEAEADKVTWELTNDGTLTIKGTGNVENLKYRATLWYEQRETHCCVY